MESKHLISIDSLDANLLSELQGWKAKQEVLVSLNPFVSITDSKSYEDAKKHRTALVTGRTDVEKQEKLITSKLKSFRDRVSEASQQLILITLPFETRQQNEVRRYEEIKLQEKAEKERLEKERKDKIKTKINDLFTHWKDKVELSTFHTFDSEKKLIQEEFENYDTSVFEEFELEFAEKKQLIENLFAEKWKNLELIENQRKEAEKLKLERAEFERKQVEINAENKRKADELAKKQIEINAENQRKEDELAKQQAEINAENQRKEDALAKQQAELEVEKNRLEKIESDRIAKERADKEAKAEADRKEAQLKRMEALKPDVEKLQDVIKSIGNDIEAPDLKDMVSKEFFTQLLAKIAKFKENLLTELEEIK